MNFAVVDEATNVVTTVVEVESDTFEPGPGYFARDVTGTMVMSGWTWNGRKFVAPDLPPPEPITSEALIAYAANKRWQVEVGGIEVGGFAVHTDDRSKMMIMGARMKAADDPDFTTDWKTAAGEFVTIDADTVLVISDAVLDHVARCFAAEAAVIIKIEAGEITDFAGIDGADWP